MVKAASSTFLSTSTNKSSLFHVGMKMEGLFRVPGPAAVLEELRMAFEEGK